MAENLTRRIVLAAAAFFLAACASGPDTTIYLVRHAEKTAVANDPALTPDGEARAEALADRLNDAALTAIYSTDTTRTKTTAEPIAKRLLLPIFVYDGRALEDFARDLKAQTGQILVVGHSNTTPDLVDLLGGDPVGAINEAGEYDRLYVVTIEDGEISSVLERYGAAYEPASAE